LIYHALGTVDTHLHIRLSDKYIYFIWSISNWYLICLTFQMNYILRIKMRQ